MNRPRSVPDVSKFAVVAFATAASALCAGCGPSRASSASGGLPPSGWGDDASPDDAGDPIESDGQGGVIDARGEDAHRDAWPPPEPDGAAEAGGSEPGADAGADAPGQGSESDGSVEAGLDGGSTFVTPVCDGVITPGEYGIQVDGDNQQTTSSGQVWWMTFGPSRLYVAISNATTSEAAVLYVSSNPSAPIDAGAESAGATTGMTYDGERAAQLPMQSQIVTYVKDGYNEVRLADATGNWSPARTFSLTACAGPNSTREWSVPWALLRGGRPASFGWLGYLTSASGFVYGQVPQGNPSGSIGTSAVLPWLYLVANATPVTGTFPFASAVQR